MVFDRMQPPDAQDGEYRVRFAVLRDARANRVSDSHAPHQNLRGFNVRVVFENVTAIEIGNGHAETALHQLEVEEGRMKQ